MPIVNSTIACCTDPPVHIRLEELPGATRYPRFPGAKIRLDGFTAMIFRSGKLNIVGLKNLSRLNEAVQSVTAFIREAGYPVSLIAELQNVVVSDKLYKTINLPDAHRKLIKSGYSSMLELELYPAIRVWKFWTGMIYHTGSIIITGLKSAEEGIDAVDGLKSSLC